MVNIRRYSSTATYAESFDGFATLIGNDHEKMAPSVDWLNAVTSSDDASAEASHHLADMIQDAAAEADRRDVGPPWRGKDVLAAKINNSQLIIPVEAHRTFACLRTICRRNLPLNGAEIPNARDGGLPPQPYLLNGN